MLSNLMNVLLDCHTIATVSGFLVMVSNPIVMTMRFLATSMPPNDDAASACVAKLVWRNATLECMVVPLILKAIRPDRKSVV